MTCPIDCGACPVTCGDGSCNGGKTCSSCSADCGACPANCAAVESCGACTANPACGWCTFAGACQAGTNSGPSGSSTCAIFPGWIRSSAACNVDSGVRDTGVFDTGGGGTITDSCPTSTPAGLAAQCGWRLARSYSCASGTSVLVGCTDGADAGTGVSCGARLGSCTGDPMMRVCPGSGPCTSGLTISSGSADDGCGLCPLGRFVCPPVGSVTIYERAYDHARSASCSIGRGL